MQEVIELLNNRSCWVVVSRILFPRHTGLLSHSSSDDVGNVGRKVIVGSIKIIHVVRRPNVAVFLVLLLSLWKPTIAVFRLFFFFFFWGNKFFLYSPI